MEAVTAYGPLRPPKRRPTFTNWPRYPMKRPTERLQPFIPRAGSVGTLGIQAITARYFGLELSDMRSKAKPNYIARPRMIAMYLSRAMTTRSYPSLGTAFQKHHTSVLHAVRRVSEVMETCTATRDAVISISQTVIYLRAIGDCMKAMEVLALEGLQ